MIPCDRPGWPDLVSCRLICVSTGTAILPIPSRDACQPHRLCFVVTQIVVTIGIIYSTNTPTTATRATRTTASDDTVGPPRPLSLPTPRNVHAARPCETLLLTDCSVSRGAAPRHPTPKPSVARPRACRPTAPVGRAHCLSGETGRRARSSHRQNSSSGDCPRRRRQRRPYLTPRRRRCRARGTP